MDFKDTSEIKISKELVKRHCGLSDIIVKTV